VVLFRGFLTKKCEKRAKIIHHFEILDRFLEQLIMEVKPSMLLIEHDEKFLQKIKAKIIKITAA
jgi:hypothetical protein